SLADDAEEMSRELNHLSLVSGFEQRVAADDLLRLGEGAVGDRDLPVGSFVNANARGAEIDAFGCDQPPRLHALFDEFAHSGHFGLGRGAVRGFVRENADEAHVYPPGSNFCLPATILSNGGAANRHDAQSFLGESYRISPSRCDPDKSDGAYTES